MKLALIRKIDFKFSNLMHSALVSMTGTNDEMFVHIQLINSFMKKVFGVEHIRFSNSKGEIRLQENKHPFTYQVAQIITSQIKEDLQDYSTSTLRAV
ncbi:MAG TPA: hypothetical protein VNT20_17095 [Flavisolibacter sp.]|nr:hypothetical protein [Flavisolibacter sp.]